MRLDRPDESSHPRPSVSVAPTARYQVITFVTVLFDINGDRYLPEKHHINLWYKILDECSFINVLLGAIVDCDLLLLIIVY
jgi:hypothetical protein